jgi:hypothetical protein
LQDNTTGLRRAVWKGVEKFSYHQLAALLRLLLGFQSLGKKPLNTEQNTDSSNIQMTV